MPDSELDRKLYADRLSGAVDKIREAVHGRLGTRPYKVSVITRRWSGRKTGEGTYRDEILDIVPSPEVVRGGTNRFGPGGQEGTNRVTLKDISFRYTDNELYPKQRDPNVEIVYMLERTFGGDPNTLQQEFFTVENSPTPERGDKHGDRIAWSVKLHETQGFSPPDRINA